jgi:hypothetical protein
LRLCRGLRVTLWSLLLINRLRLLRLLGLWLWRLRVTLGSRLGRIALRLLWLCVLRLLRRIPLGSLLLGRLTAISLHSLLACKGAILCLGQGRNTAGQARLLVARINWLQVKANVELNTRLAVVVQLVLACVKRSIRFL